MAKDWLSSGQWIHVQAHLISYEVEDLDSPAKKTSRDCKVAVCPVPFGKGAMRFAFYVVDEEHESRLVGKVYQFDDAAYQSKSTYEGDMMSQAVAQFMAKDFSIAYPATWLQSSLRGPPPQIKYLRAKEMPIKFVQAQLLVLDGATPELPFKFMALEPWIPGSYEKFTSNAGHITADSDLAQAFSHYTFQQSGGEILVSDIQGVKTTLTDPQIHSEDVDRFGRGNLRTKGMDMFFSSHICSDICRALELEAYRRVRDRQRNLTRTPTACLCRGRSCDASSMLRDARHIGQDRCRYVVKMLRLCPKPSMCRSL